MSLRSIINFGEVIDFAIGINIHYSAVEKKDISFCVLKKEKEILRLEKMQSGLQHMDDLLQHIEMLVKKGACVHINFSGQPVLQREVHNNLESVELSNYTKIFPGIRKDDFIIQQYVGKEMIFYALLRLEDALREINFFHDQVSSVTLGVNILQVIRQFFVGDAIQIKDYKVSFRNSDLIGIDTLESSCNEEYEIAGEKINSDCMLAYAGAVSLFAPTERIKVIGAPVSLLAAAGKHASRRSIFLTGRFVLIAILSILTIKTLIFFWIDKEINDARVSVSYFQGKNKKDTQLERMNLKMHTAYQNIGWSFNRIPLYYADQVALTVPNEIELDILEIGVLNEERLRKDKRLSFYADQIKISGVSDDPAVLSKWITLLQKLPWVSNVGDQKYQHDNRQHKGTFEFTIRVSSK